MPRPESISNPTFGLNVCPNTGISQEPVDCYFTFQVRGGEWRVRGYTLSASHIFERAQGIASGEGYPTVVVKIPMGFGPRWLGNYRRNNPGGDRP